MPRYRKLYTKTLESLDVNDMPDDFTRLFWVYLPLVLCREGRGLNSATWLKSKLFPLREDVTQDQVQAALDWCIHRGMIVPYCVDGRDYFYLPSFHTYQGNTTKEAESDYPPPQSQVGRKSGVSPELVQSKSDTDADAICNMQYSDADADATAAADASKPTSAVAAVLKRVHELGVTDPKAKQLAAVAADGGWIHDLPMVLEGWIAHFRGRGGVTNPIGLAITQVEAGEMPPRAPNDGDERRRRYLGGEWADIIEH